VTEGTAGASTFWRSSLSTRAARSSGAPSAAGASPAQGVRHSCQGAGRYIVTVLRPVMLCPNGDGKS
jgi:hypothetical protein